MTTTTIRLENLTFDMLIGILPEEQITPQPVRISAAITLRTPRIPSLLEQSFDYAILHDYITGRAQIPTSLVETLAGDILDYCLRHNSVASASVTVMKPAALAPAEVGVTIEGKNSP